MTDDEALTAVIDAAVAYENDYFPCHRERILSAYEACVYLCEALKVSIEIDGRARESLANFNERDARYEARILATEEA
jgi:hypothetical protein